MAYLNLDLDYFSHPKTRRLTGLLGRGAEMLPPKLWAYCGKYHSADGELTGYSGQEVEAIVDWWGKQGECIAAMVRCGFLEKTEDGFRVKNWVEHQGHIEAMKERARNAAIARWSKVKDPPDEECLRIASSSAGALLKQCPSDRLVQAGTVQAGTESQEVTIPPNGPFPKQVVLDFFQKHFPDYTGEQVAKAWDEMEGTRDQHGRWRVYGKVVHDFRYAIESCIRNGSPVKDRKLWAEIKALETGLEIHTGNPDYNGEKAATKENKAEYREMKRKLHQLKEEQARQVLTS